MIYCLIVSAYCLLSTSLAFFLTMGYLVCWLVSLLSFLSGSFSPPISSSNFPRERLWLVQTVTIWCHFRPPHRGCLWIRCWFLAQPVVAKVVGEMDMSMENSPSSLSKKRQWTQKLLWVLMTSGIQIPERVNDKNGLVNALLFREEFCTV